MIFTLAALISASPPLQHEWRFEQSGAVCTADLAGLGTSADFTLLKDAADADWIYVKLSNPAWSMTNSQPLAIHYMMLPYRDSRGIMRPAIHVTLEPTVVEAKAMIETTNGRSHGALGFLVPRKHFDDMVKSSQLGLRIAVYRADQALTDWIKLDPAIRISLDRCSDPFAG